MTKFAPVFLATLFLTLSACNDDFSLEGDFQDVPTALAFLDAEDERHFIRVQKAFLEAGGNAETNAGISDTIFYGENEATVSITRTGTQESTELARVNGRDFGLNRSAGLFAGDPNVLYSFTDDQLNLRGGDRVRLDISRPGQETATAETTILSPIDIRSPGDMVRLNNFDTPLIFVWTADENTSIYDVRIRFHIRELILDSSSPDRDVDLEWTIANEYVPGNDFVSGRNVRFLVDKIGFYRFLGDNLVADANVRRRLLGFDVVVTGAGEEVVARRTLANANAGITSSQALPRYTNLVGGIGLITSTTTAIKTDVDFDQNSRDSLRFGQFTRDLNF